MPTVAAPNGDMVPEPLRLSVLGLPVPCPLKSSVTEAEVWAVSGAPSANESNTTRRTFPELAGDIVYPFSSGADLIVDAC